MAEPRGVLGRIVADRRRTLAERYGSTGIEAVRQGVEPTKRSLARAIAEPGARFICEFKRSSPSQGAIRKSADPAAIASAYCGVADAMSVLVEPDHFGGSLEDLASVRQFFDGPILAKDFLVDPRQIAEARRAGADAVLVMLSVLDDGEAAAMIAEARLLGMDALVEVHDEAEMNRALALGAPLIGINNRDLVTLDVDLAVTERLAPLASDRLLVAESGIFGRADVRRLAPLVDGFLIGTSLMRADDPADAVRELIFGRVKLCGLRTAGDLAAARRARFAGLMFVADSPRHLTLAEAEAMLADAPAGLLPVGIFRDAPIGEVATIAERLGLHAVQLHGSEDEAYRARLRRHLRADCEIWQAVAVGNGAFAADHEGAERLLFDTAHGGRSGGTGERFDWALVAGHPRLGDSLIAGGIGPANAAAAMRLGAYAIDVGSGVDEAPGVKSAAKIAELFEALRPPSREVAGR